MKLILPDVTVVLIDCVAHDLSRLALEDTLDIISPRNIIICSDDYRILPRNRSENRLTFVPCQCKSLDEVAQVLWYEVPRHVQTSHMLIIQYDGWPINAALWKNQFMKYDYIGAPWPWVKVNSVGNGGFSLRSTRLMQYLAASEGRANFPLVPNMPEDGVLCRDYRVFLELDGFSWAPSEIASEFSTEHDGDPTKTFGFHGSFNFKKILSPASLNERKKLANSYIRSTVAWQELKKQRTAA